MPTPRRIFFLYVPSRDVERLLAKFGISCYMEPLIAAVPDPTAENKIAWRHDLQVSLDTIAQSRQRAKVATGNLKVEITDKRTSALALPARNFLLS